MIVRSHAPAELAQAVRPRRPGAPEHVNQRHGPCRGRAASWLRGVAPTAPWRAVEEIAFALTIKRASRSDHGRALGQRAPACRARVARSATPAPRFVLFDGTIPRSSIPSQVDGLVSLHRHLLDQSRVGYFFLAQPGSVRCPGGADRVLELEGDGIMFDGAPRTTCARPSNIEARLSTTPGAGLLDAIGLSTASPSSVSRGAQPGSPDQAYSGGDFATGPRSPLRPRATARSPFGGRGYLRWRAISQKGSAQGPPGGGARGGARRARRLDVRADGAGKGALLRTTASLRATAGPRTTPVRWRCCPSARATSSSTGGWPTGLVPFAALRSAAALRARRR